MSWSGLPVHHLERRLVYFSPSLMGNYLTGALSAKLDFACGWHILEQMFETGVL